MWCHCTPSSSLFAYHDLMQDFLSLTLFAYLESCGVRAFNMRRFPSFNRPELIAEQYTVQWQQRQPAGELTAEQEQLLQNLPSFALDLCPDDEPTGCY